MAVDHWTMKIQDKFKIDGQSPSHSDGKEIEIYGASFAVSRAWRMDGNNKNMPEGRGAISEISVSKEVDLSSPKLYYACVSGKNLGKVSITGWTNVSNKDQMVVQYTLEDVGISSVSSSNDTESLSLSYIKIKWDYNQIDDDGSVKGKGSNFWDLTKLKGE